MLEGQIMADNHTEILRLDRRFEHDNLEVCHPRSVKSIVQCIMCTYLHIHAVKNTIIISIYQCMYNI